MFAPAHHQATRYVMPVRRELAVRTIFNFLGPLTNPAGAARQLIGVSDPAYIETIAGALALLGTRHALVVSSDDGLDELSICAPTQVVEVLGGSLRRFSVTPDELGLQRAPADAVPGGDPTENADTARRIFAGERGAARDLAVFNAGAAIYAGGGATRSSRASEPPSGRSTTAPPPPARAVRRAHPGGSGVNKLEEIVDAHAARRSRRRGAAPGADRRGTRGAEPRRAFAAALAAPRDLADRRAQAQLALGGDDPRGSPLEDVVGAYERGGAAALSISPRGRASAARSTISAPLGPRRAFRSCARTSSSIRTRCTRRSPAAPTRSC